jgi:uncharacterized protein YbcI
VTAATFSAHDMTETVANTHDEQSLTARISTEVVRTLKETFGKGPVKAKSYLLDDFLLVVMRGGMTVAEETMLARGHGDLVRQFRQTYQNEIGDVLIAKVEALTGRNVATYQSQVLFDPHIMMEIFFFEDGAADGGPAEVEIAP